MIKIRALGTCYKGESINSYAIAHIITNGNSVISNSFEVVGEGFGSPSILINLVAVKLAIERLATWFDVLNKKTLIEVESHSNIVINSLKGNCKMSESNFIIVDTIKQLLRHRNVKYKRLYSGKDTELVRMCNLAFNIHRYGDLCMIGSKI